MTWTAGRKVRASEINDSIPIFGRCSADLTKTSNTTLADVTGLSVAVAASTLYALDGYIAYDAGATGDLKMAITVPSGLTGSWCLVGLGTATTGSVGDVDMHRLDAFGSGNTISLGGSASFSGALACLPRAYLSVSSTAGTVQFQAAQNTSNGTSTVIKSGSWIRIVKIG